MAKTKSKSKHDLIKKVVLYVILIIIAALMAIPFIWMLSASIKSDREVFRMDPFVLIPKNPKWSNYVQIRTKIPMLTFVKNTVFLTIIVTLLQLFTSSFAAYAFAKLQFKFRNGLFLAYIATIAMPWQVYMVPQFLMMRSFGLNDKLLAIICLQAFSAFGVFMMKQFYEGIPNELSEAARIDGMTEYHHASSFEAGALDTHDIYICKYLERLPWTAHLFEVHKQKDNTARTQDVHKPVLIGLRSYHGRLGSVTHTCHNRVHVPAEVFCGRRCIYGA